MNRTETLIPGFDSIADGGIPEGRATLVAGTSGSAKTVFASQFLAEAVENRGEGVVFVTFEETPEDLCRNLYGFGWDIDKWKREGKWAFVDVSLRGDADFVEIGEYDLGALFARIRYAAEKVSATRIVVDSLGTLFSQLTSSTIVRREIHKMGALLKELGVTSIITAERLEEYGNVSRFGVEEFVADNVVILRNNLIDERRRRTVEILKFRGTPHQKGEYPFTVVPGRGLVVIPLSGMTFRDRHDVKRVSSGNSGVNDLCGGGFFSDSTVLVSGPTGTGKTLMSCEFAAEGARKGETVVIFAFEESANQIIRNAEAWGIEDIESLHKKGLIKILSAYPEAAGIEDHLVSMKERLEELRPSRVVVDSISALRRIAGEKGYREFLLGLLSHIKMRDITTMLTSTTKNLMGGSTITEAHVSTLTDVVVLLRYVEILGEIRRSITILKMRGSDHDRRIHEYKVRGDGLTVKSPFNNLSGILTGTPVSAIQSDTERPGRTISGRPDEAK